MPREFEAGEVHLPMGRGRAPCAFLGSHGFSWPRPPRIPDSASDTFGPQIPQVLASKGVAFPRLRHTPWPANTDAT